jgi:hypothetical protein
MAELAQFPHDGWQRDGDDCLIKDGKQQDQDEGSKRGPGHFAIREASQIGGASPPSMHHRIGLCRVVLPLLLLFP